MNFIGHGFGMWITLILFIIIIIYFLKISTKDTDKNISAQEILDRRYANGEISTEEYKKQSEALKNK